MMPGQHTQNLHMYRKLQAQSLQIFLALIRGEQPEFYDNKFICQGDGQDAVHAKMIGKVWVVLDITSKGMGAFGYTTRMLSKQKH